MVVYDEHTLNTLVPTIHSTTSLECAHFVSIQFHADDDDDDDDKEEKKT